MDSQIRKFVDALNKDLAYELQAIVAYTRWAAEVDGPHRNALRNMFKEEIPDELTHAQTLADKIAVLGGIPTTTPMEVPQAGDNHSRLEAVLEMEKTAIANYTRRAQEAEEIGEIGMKQRLEEMIEDETDHYEEVSMLLRNWHGAA
jgi:bacterioferritin